MKAVVLAFIARSRRARFCLALVIVAIGSLTVTSGHDLYRAFVRHRIHLAVSKDNIDLTVELTFFEDRSAQERRLMDADGNGRITQKEVESYLRKLAPQLSRQIGLQIHGRRVALMMLYEPEVDLLGSDRVGPAHHILRLFYFSRIPPAVRAGDRFIIEDGLWPQAGTVNTIEAEGHEGWTLAAQRAPEAGPAPEHSRAAGRFEVDCLTVPAVPPAP